MPISEPIMMLDRSRCPSVAWRLVAEAQKKEVRRLQKIILETIEGIRHIEATAAQLESEGR